MSNHDSRAESQRVHAITDAREAASIESRKRMRSYGIKMALRAVLFVAGAIIAATWNIWVGVALLAVSAILPWIAVVDANLITDPGGDDSATFLNAPPVDALAPGQDAAEDQDTPAAPAAEGDVIEGSFEPEPGPDVAQEPGDDERGDAPRA
ncbi:MAG: DUF3099 domain-containing protein [Arthrobacter sp.]|jgi:hypothetical protein|nr:DUF3099 domain-containing protein [Arthrobacter sp.]